MASNTTVQETDKCPLRGETVIVRHIKKDSRILADKHHIFSGGIADTSEKKIVPLMLPNGAYKQVLSNEEARYLEKCMGMEEGALSPHRKKDNFWSSGNEAAVITLGKTDTMLDLSNPADFIKYKILLSNTNLICPDVKTLETAQKASYQYVLIKSDDEMDDKKSRMNNLMESYRVYGKIEDEADKLRCIIEIINKRPLTPGTKLSWLQTTCNDIIQEQPKTFLKVAKDPLLDTKVLIKNCVENGLISNRGGMYYIRKDGQPLCGNGEEPTLAIAARWLNEPQHQELKLTLEGTLNGNE